MTGRSLVGRAIIAAAKAGAGGHGALDTGAGVCQSRSSRPGRGGTEVVKALATVWLVLCALFCGAVLVFLFQVAVKDGLFDLDWVLMLGTLAALGLPMTGAWFAFRRRWFLPAMGLGVLPVGFVLYVVSQIHIRMF